MYGDLKFCWNIPTQSGLKVSGFPSVCQQHFLRCCLTGVINSKDVFTERNAANKVPAITTTTVHLTVLTWIEKESHVLYHGKKTHSHGIHSVFWLNTECSQFQNTEYILTQPESCVQDSFIHNPIFSIYPHGMYSVFWLNAFGQIPYEKNRLTWIKMIKGTHCLISYWRTYSFAVIQNLNSSTRGRVPLNHGVILRTQCAVEWFVSLSLVLEIKVRIMLKTPVIFLI